MKRLSPNPTVLAVIAAALLLCGSIPALAQKGGGKPGPTPVYPYKFTDLGQVAYDRYDSKAYGITEPDADGVLLIVGGGEVGRPGPDYATAWEATPGGVLSANVLPGSRKGTAAVNDAGMIAYYGYSESQVAYVGMVYVPGVGTVELWPNFRPTAVNNLGQVVGSQNNSYGMLVTVNKDGTFSRELARALWGFIPYALNEAGEMAGQHGYDAAIAWFENGVLQIQDLIQGANISDESLGAGINNLGEVVGSRNGRPFLWRPAEGITWLTPAATNPGAALDINDLGQVVGWSYDSSGYRYAFLWASGNLSDLNALSGVGTKTFRLGSAEAINNAGQIVGRSDTYKGANWAGYGGTFLLTPKP